MSCIRYNKSLTITNIQLIITKIRVCMCHTDNVWSNMLIHTCIGEPSDRFVVEASLKERLVEAWFLWCTSWEHCCAECPMLLQSWHLICRGHWCCPSCFCCCRSSCVLPGGAPTVSTVRLARVLVIIAARVTSPASFSSSAPMRRGAPAIKSSKGMLCSICRGRVWGCG